jgi:hypothetical protein
MRSLPFLALLGGCVIGSNKYPRPRDLPDEWLVDRVRILAIQANPPEVTPGQDVSFNALIPQPGIADPYAVAWLTCPPVDDGGIGYGCALPDLSSIETLDLESAAEIGLIGFQPFFDPFYTVPDDALDGFAEEDRAEGLYQLVNVTAIPPDYLDPETAPSEVDFGEVEAAYKRLIISEARTPNRNPLLSRWVVDGFDIPENTTITVEEGQVYTFETTVAESLVEEYVFITSEGAEEWRTEEPYVNWYCTDGELYENLTLYPYLDVTWQAPASGTSGSLYAVVRDRRGGMAWIERKFTVL